MGDEEKTRRQLIQELNQLRERLRVLEAEGLRLDQEINGRPSPDSIGDGMESPRRLSTDGDSTETIDLTNLFRTDITSSGSFDVRGDIWATTFGKVLQAVPIPILLVDQSYTVTVANEACGRISPDYETVIGSPFRSLFANHSRGAEFHGLAEKVFEDRKPRTAQAILKIVKGSMWGRMSVRSIRIMNERFLLIIIEDLTAEKRQLRLNQKQQEALRSEIAEHRRSQKALEESELRFRQIYESAPMMMQTVDTEGIIRNINSKWLRDMGYSRDEIIGRTIQSICSKESRKVLPSVFERLWHLKEIRDVHLQYRRKDGYLVEVLIDAVVTEDPRWGTVGLSTIRDVTHQMILEQRLREAQKMEAIGTLAGGVAHDFNNLLQIILGFSDFLLMRKERTAPDYPALNSIREAARRGSDLVNQILTFSRKVPTSPRPVNLNDVIQSAEKLLSRTIPKMVHIELDLLDDVRPTFADPGQIQQVLINLALNAKDAMPEGGKVTISTRNVSLDERYCRVYPEVHPGEYVALTVSDTGHGMDRDVVDRIFEPFFTTKSAGEGTGLGLAMVFGIVKSHGGHIVCHSRPGAGTTFTVYFPAMELEIESDVASTADFPAFGRETILMVDDEEMIRRFAMEVLSQVGYKVLVAGEAGEALEIYRAEQPHIDLVVLDLVMPGIGGKQCLEELLAMDPHAKVLVASGYLIDQRTMAFLERNAKGIVKKPFRVSEFLSAVRAVLDQD